MAKEVAGFAVEMTDLVENIGTKVFGDNDFGKTIDELNPLNLGFYDLMEYADKVLNENKTVDKKQKK